MRTNGAQLEVNGEIVANPTESDIDAAIDKIEQGFVTVTRSGGFYLEATPSDEGSDRLLNLACGDEQKGERQLATAPVKRTEAKALFGNLLEGGDAWRQRCTWRPLDKTATASKDTLSNRSWRSMADWLVGGGAVAFLLIVGIVPVLLPAALAVALCVFVVGKAWREVRVRRWPIADGRITASGLRPRRRRFMQEATRLDNVPAVTYEFSVAGRRYVGSRLGLNTEYAGINVGALVAQYPVGSTVTVHYSPSDPNDCLLEPYANSGLLADVLKLFAILGVFFAVLYYSASALARAVAAHFPNANAPHAVIALSAGFTFLILFVWSFRPQPSMAATPRASGKIVKREVEEVTLGNATADFARGAGSYLQPTIEVAYSVDGQHYILRTAIGEGIGAKARADAEARLAPYLLGATVSVLYDRANPGASSLEANLSTIARDPTQTRHRLAALACAFACFVAATIELGVL